MVAPPPGRPNARAGGRLSFRAYQATAYFRALDGLRAAAILLVLLHHVPDVGASCLQTLQANGRYGVSFFFVISGFLICTLFLRERDLTGRIDLWKFYGRRALRLLPLYYAVLLGEAALVFGLHQYSPANQALFQAKLPAYLFYYSNWLPTATQGPFFLAWSLAVEEQFYLLFGLLMLGLTRRWIIGAAAAALAAKMGVYGVWGSVDVNSAFCRVLFSYQEPVLWGVLTAFVLHDPQGYRFLARWLGRRWVLGGIGAGLAGWLAWHPMRTGQSLDAQLLYLLMTVVLAGCVVRPAVPGLCASPLVHVGKISYGIYLLHMWVVILVKKLLPFPGEAVFLASLVGVTFVASVVYRYFEFPIITYYKQRLAPRRANAPPLSEPSPCCR